MARQKYFNEKLSLINFNFSILFYFNFSILFNISISLFSLTFSHRKAPEFQCHIRYKNDLPLPPVSSVLFDSTLTLPKNSLLQILRDESVVYSPTSLEKGTRHFSLPVDLLKFSVYNLVDLEGRQGSGKEQVQLEDKEILISIEEWERKLNVSTSTRGKIITSASTSANGGITASTNTPTANKKFSRPDVTWLRRTEYISSVKNNPNTSTSSPEDDAKTLLADSVPFQEILNQVKATFEHVKNEKHPVKKDTKLIQSYPIVLDESGGHLVHCLFFGDQNSVTPEGSILKFPSSSSSLVATLFNPSLKSQGQFDVQHTEAGKSFALMLPAEGGRETGTLAKIESTFSLRKRRNAPKEAKIIKVTRQ